MRFPCARDTDPDAYKIRLEYLAKDTAHLAVPLLRKACDRAAQTARGLPYASEILACATTILEERQRVAAPINVTPNRVEGAANPVMALRARAYNLDNAMRGSPMRWTDDMQPVDLSDKFERRICTADGQVVWP